VCCGAAGRAFFVPRGMSRSICARAPRALRAPVTRRRASDAGRSPGSRRPKHRARSPGVTEVDAAWLADAAPPLVALSAPHEAPAPRYVPRRDAVLAWHAAAFGRHGWELPPVARPVGDAAGRARCFASALLAGAVLPAFAGARRAAARRACPGPCARAKNSGWPSRY